MTELTHRVSAVCRRGRVHGENVNWSHSVVSAMMVETPATLESREGQGSRPGDGVEGEQGGHCEIQVGPRVTGRHEGPHRGQLESC